MKKCISILLGAVLTVLPFGVCSCSLPTPEDKPIGHGWDYEIAAEPVNGEMLVHFIDVGQADSALIQCGGENMLIDGGNVDDSQTVVSYLKDCGVETIDYMICTHAHEDHCGGLNGPLRSFEIENVLAPKTQSDAKFYDDFLDGIYAKNIEIENPEPGNKYSIGEAEFVILGPITESSDDLNNTSIVLKLVHGENSFLFTGDAEREEEEEILSSGADISADVLKVGHHGSKNSTVYPFLRAVEPQYAVISVGKDNSYGHPTEEALSRLRDADVTVYRTDMQGHITAKSDGKEITFTTVKNSGVQTNTTENEKTQTSYIGNKTSKKLHKASCSGLPKEENREYFSDMETAFAKGYIQCKLCF